MGDSDWQRTLTLGHVYSQLGSEKTRGERMGYIPLTSFIDQLFLAVLFHV
jgi:hypothetical protein